MSSEVGDRRLGAVRLDRVTKVYDRSRTGRRWRAGIPGLREKVREPLAALADLDLRVDPGEAVGLIGPNGAGKSTVLKLVAGVTAATSGSVEVGGLVGSMIELGLGFHPELTGRENVWCSAAMLGIERSETAAAFDSIIEFAGLAHVVDTPLKHYSSGMAARLGFAVATAQPVAVLAVDEVLAVGDREFQIRCIDRIHRMVAAGTTLLFTSHEMAMVAAVCDRAVHLREGRIVDDGPAAPVVERYLAPTPSHYLRMADPPLDLHEVQVIDERIRPWQPVSLCLDVTVRRPISRVEVGVELSSPTHSPERPFARCSTTVDSLSTPGRFRWEGRSAPFPAEGSLVRATVTLVDGMRRELMAAGSVDVRVEGRQLSGKPSFAVVPEWVIEPVSAAERKATSPSIADAGNSDLLEVKALEKRFWSGLRRSAARQALPWSDVGDGDVLAVDGVSMGLSRGEFLGIIGPNGSGKSTLLRMIAGVIEPTGGSLTTWGRTVPVLALGLGFHPDLTGLENLRYTAALLGIAPGEVENRLDEIVAFSGIGPAIGTQVKRYSTGMRARLGLALALHADADLLLIDELLTVGDVEFRREVALRIRQEQRRGMSLIFVSHELRLIEELCDRVVRLERGALVDDGHAEDVIERYGGPAWAGGSIDAIGAVRLHDVTVADHLVPIDGDLVVHGLIEVIDPSPTARVEVSYRATLPDRSIELTVEEREAMSFFVATVEPAGASLSARGWYWFTAVVPDNRVLGEFDVVVAVVDEDTGEIVSEAWQSIVVGHLRAEGFPGPLFDVEWATS